MTIEALARAISPDVAAVRAMADKDIECPDCDGVGAIDDDFGMPHQCETCEGVCWVIECGRCHETRPVQFAPKPTLIPSPRRIYTCQEWRGCEGE